VEHNVFGGGTGGTWLLYKSIQFGGGVNKNYKISMRLGEKGEKKIRICRDQGALKRYEGEQVNKRRRQCQQNHQTRGTGGMCVHVQKKKRQGFKES